MPATETMEMLVRKMPLTEGDWLRLLEARRALLAPYLDIFTLPELGRLKCLIAVEGRPCELGVSRPVVTPEGYSLQTQGVFGSQPWDQKEETRDEKTGLVLGGIKRVWGLGRSNRWLIVRIEYVYEPGGHGWRDQRATKVEIRKAELAGVVAETGVNPREIWEELGKIATLWVERQTRLHQMAREVAVRVDFENELLDLVEGV